MIRDSKHSALRALALALAALGGLVAAPAVAQVPDLMPYQGYLTDDAGDAYEGDVSLTFRMYQDGDAPGAMWTEQWDGVPVEGGVFYVYLGMFSPVADAIASGNARYLGVSISGQGEATPRQRVGSVPYALMARDAQSLDGYSADDFATQGELGNFARWDALDDRGYVTWVALDERGYLTGLALDERGYATEQWVREYVGEQAYLTAADIEDIDVDLEGYATEDWVRGYVGEQGYLRADGLEGYATEQWVRDQGYTDEDWVRGYVGEQGYLRADGLEGYATEQWVRDQGYTDEDWVRGYIGEQDYLRAGALEGYATEQWVRDQGYTDEDWVRGYVGEQGYLRADALEGYATEQWVRDQGYLTGAALEGYATEQWVRDQGYITGAALDARNYANTAYVDTLRADVSRTYVTNAALDARAYITAAALDGLATDDAVTALGARIDALEAELAQVAAAGAPYLLGRSAQASNGRFSFNNQTGIKAAHEMCRASFANEPTAHFCSPDEVFRAVSTGSYDANNRAAMNSTSTWTVTQSALTSRGNSSLNGSCQNLMYNSGDASSGTRLQVIFGYQSNGNGGGLTGDVVQIQQEIGCGENLPVLCCR